MDLMSSVLLFHLCCLIAMIIGCYIKDNCDDGKK